MKKLHSIKGKKGSISSILVDFWAYLLFVLIILIFYALFTFQGNKIKENEITGIDENIKISIGLLNYLRTPIIIDGNEINVAELIRLWRLEPGNYKDILEKASVDILSSMEYEYTNPRANNILVRGFNVIINTEKREDNVLDHLIDLKSKSFETGFCITNGHSTCATFGEHFLPVSESKSLYIVLFESGKAK